LDVNLVNKQSGSSDGYADITLISLARTVVENKWTFAGVFSACVSISIFVAVLMTPVYSSSVIVSPASGDRAVPSSISGLMAGLGGGSISSMLGAAGGGNSRAVDIFALSSPFFMMTFIEEWNLLPVLFEGQWDADKEAWLTDDPLDIPTLSDGYDFFSGEVVSVVDDTVTNLVNVTVEWTDPSLAAEWANDLIVNANERLRAQAIDDADLTIEYLKQELAKTNAVELQQAIYFLVESEIQKRTMAKVQDEYAILVLSPATSSDVDKYMRPN
jgi:hypothetical protein